MALNPGPRDADVHTVMPRTRLRVPGAEPRPEVPGLDVLGEVGRGSASAVWRVRRSGADYALKVLDAPGEEALVAFRREAALLAALEHPHLPRVHEVGQTRGRPYLVTDFVSGRQLADVVAGAPLPPGRALELVLDVVEQLAALHRQGLVHRDLKPQNIMVGDDGSARLVDFGLAARLAGARTAGHPGPPTAVGTLAYAPPEQSGTLNRPVDPRSDLYALGVVLFECLTGRRPFPTDDAGELLHLHATMPAPDVRDRAPEVSPALAAVVAALLAKDPDDRYQSAEALAGDLQRLRDIPEAEFAPRRSGNARERLGRARLCGRDTELQQLLDLWEQAGRGRGRLAVVRGEAGIGTTRLAEEVARTALREGAPVLTATCRSGAPVPLAPLRQAVERLLDDAEGLSTLRRTELHQRMRVAAGPAAGLLARLSPALGRLLGADPLPDADRQEQFSAALGRFLCELARLSGGMVMLLDGAEAMDPATARVLDHVAARLPEVPLLVLATSAGSPAGPSAGVSTGLSALGADLDLSLGPLDEAGVTALVASRLPGVDAGSDLTRLLLVRGHGNPFLTVEYLQAIVDAGLLRPYWGTWQLDAEALDRLALPEDALGLVLARVATLSPHTRRLLEIAAATGPRFEAEVVAEVAATELGRTLTALTDAAGHDLIELRGGGAYAFVHERVREALLDGLEPAHLRRLHSSIAAALDRRYRAAPPGGDDGSPLASSLVYAVAQHSMLGDPTASQPRAGAVCAIAGRLALAAHAPEQAVVFLTHAATVRPRDPRLLLTLGTALLRQGRYADARARLDQALQLEDDPVRRARVLLRLTEVHRATWDTDEAVATVEQGLAELGAGLPAGRFARTAGTALRAALATVIAVTGFGFATARGAERERLDLVAALHRQGGYIGTVGLRPQTLFMHHLRALLPAVRLGAGREHALNTAAAAVLAVMTGLRRLALRLIRVAERAALDVGDPQLVAHVAWYAGAAAYLGRLDDGERWARCLEEHGQWLDAGQYSDAVATICWDAAVQGRAADAQRWYERGRRRVGAGTGVGTGADAGATSLHSLGPVSAAAGGRVAEAGTELRRIRAELDGHPGVGLRANALLAEIFALSEQAEYGPPFEETVARFEALGLNPRRMIRPHRTWFVLHAQGRLAQVRTAAPPHRDERLAAAAAAVASLRTVADTPLLRAWHDQCWAELSTLCGDPDRALRRLAALPPLDQDAPAASFEIWCTRARALRAAGHAAEATHHAVAARALAETSGWPQRARRVAEEFRLRADSPGAPGAHGRFDVDTDLRARRERQRLAALEAVGAAASRVLDPDELARVALDETLGILSAERAVLFLTPLDPDPDPPLRFRLGRDADGHDVPELTGYSSSLVERVRRTREPLVVTGTDEGAALGAQSAVLHGLRSIMVAPLLLEGRLLGVVYLDSQVAKGIFTTDDVGILTALTNHIATSLETARAAQLELSVESARRRRDLAENLREALTEMSSSLDPQQVLDRLVGAAGRLLPADRCWLLRRSTSGPATTAGMLAPATLAARPPAAGTVSTLAFDRELVAVLAAGRPVGGGRGGAPPPGQLRSLLAGAGSWLVLPLLADGAGVGLLVLTGDEDALADAEVEVADTLVAQGMTAYEKAGLFTRLEELAVVDELTGVSTRRHFFELAARELAGARRHARPLVALMVDIDHFKRVNDGHGHPTGDDVIRAVAERLSGVLRDTDLIGRYGGEEFAVVLPDTDRGEQLAQRMLGAVARTPVPTRSGPITVTVSVGLTRLTAEDYEMRTLIDRADLALYAAKAGGRDQYQVR